ncbi:hypothetical protein [Archangium primigenium]|uniref:hypothetical protein n=1 Tax=[Archangium] primigenium TaxID=2792470 RepID=UPI001956CD3B
MGLCIFAAPEIVVGTVLVLGVVVVALAIEAELDAYASKRKPTSKSPPDPKQNPQPLVPTDPHPADYAEWRERCTDHYIKCTGYFAGMKEPRVYGESLCQSCSRVCRRTGRWPTEFSGHPCPGG